MSVLPRNPRARSYLRADDRRAQILDVARRVFAQHGFHRANIADICQAARIARGTLYQYFDNKRAVFLAVLEGIAERVEQVLRARPRVAETPEAAAAPRSMIVAFATERLRELLDAVFEDEVTLRLILREARGLDGAVETLVQRIDGLVLGYAQQDIKAAQDAGIFRQDVDARLVARFILGGIEKMVLTALSLDEAIDLGAVVDVSTAIQLFGLLEEDRR